MGTVTKLVTQPERAKLREELEGAGIDIDVDLLLQRSEEIKRDTEELFGAPEEERAAIYRRLKNKYGEGIVACGPGIPED